MTIAFDFRSFVLLAALVLLGRSCLADDSLKEQPNAAAGGRATLPDARPRLRDIGVSIGVLATGPTNSLTDVDGVQVGHHTIVKDDSVRTGVTVVKPHAGNVFLQKVPAAIHVANGFGKFVGTTQVDELGVIETPIVLTNTLSAFAAADALVGWTLKQPGCETVRSVNPIVGECNDGHLNDIRRRAVIAGHVEAALQEANTGSVVEGCVGAGTGVRCMGWKGGIGSSSRQLPEKLGGYTVGVLVQTNFGGSLTVAGAPVGRKLGRYYLKDEVKSQEHGSCIVIIATDAPLDSRRLKRLARRAPLGLAAAGSPISHGSGDYVLVFSTAKELRTAYQSKDAMEQARVLRDDQLSPLFQAVRDATEEAVINSMLQAVDTTGHRGRTVAAIDPVKVADICRIHGVVQVENTAKRLLQTEQLGSKRTLQTGVDRDLAEKLARLPMFLGPTPGVARRIMIPTIDISNERKRHSVVARGTADTYHGHCDTVLLPDGKTMFTAWTVDHAQRIGPLARSEDGGRTWSAQLDVPANWHSTANTPAIHRLVDPQGKARLVVFGDGLDWRRKGRPPYPMHQAISADNGKTWTGMKPNGVQGEVPPKTILSFDEGRRLVLWSDLPGYVVQSESTDGGQTWHRYRHVLRIPNRWGQPCVIRAPDTTQLLMLLRENSRRHHSLYSVSNDNAQTWSEPRELPASMTGDRHVARFAPDGRLVVAMRDMANTSPSYGHYVAWVGRFADIVAGHEGQYRIKLLNNAARTETDVPGQGNTDCGYSDLEVLPDGTIVATTYIKYQTGPEQNSVVNTRFKLAEIDRLLIAE